jgi:hypothetical protein
MDQGNEKQIPAAPVFQQHGCAVQLLGWVCLHCGSHVETTRAKNLATHTGHSRGMELLQK